MIKHDQLLHFHPTLSSQIELFPTSTNYQEKINGRSNLYNDILQGNINESDSRQQSKQAFDWKMASVQMRGKQYAIIHSIPLCTPSFPILIQIIQTKKLSRYNKQINHNKSSFNIFIAQARGIYKYNCTPRTYKLRGHNTSIY